MAVAVADALRYGLCSLEFYGLTPDSPAWHPIIAGHQYSIPDGHGRTAVHVENIRSVARSSSNGHTSSSTSKDRLVPVLDHADVRNALERVGDPADIAAEARERFGIKPARRSWTDPAAIILLLIGGFTIIGWFVGVVLLWISDAWNTRDKIIGTLVVPGGLAGSLGVGLASSGVRGASCGPVEISVAPGPCATVPSNLGSVVGLILAVLVVIAPIATAIYLSLRLRQARLSSFVEGGEQ